ncbi:MAG: ABC transporter ATP-binding protein [Chloroflexia bacterium]|nr:ABC transporter ATP-binding protein [Chloroflexia bacterium]
MIDIQDLRVKFGNHTVVDGLSLEIRRGEVFGLLGPNGAGKTTILAAIQGLRRPNAGTILVDGLDVAREPFAVKRRLGVQLQKTAFFPMLRVKEMVALFAALYEQFPSPQEIAALLARFGLESKAEARPGQLSGGQQQRLALALAVVNSPTIVLLDEPTTGLDPQAKRGVWGAIERLRDEGRTVLLTTHSMEEAQVLCDRVGIIDAGRLVALGTPAALIERHAPPLAAAEAARREPNLEDVFLALAGRRLAEPAEDYVADAA